MALCDVIAFVKERVHNGVEIDILGIFGRSFIVTNLAPPKNSSGANSPGANDVVAINHVLCLSHVFLHVSACLFVKAVGPLFRLWCTCLSNSGLCFLAVWTVIKQVALFTIEDRVTGILRTGLS